jgi:hypothetical protein
MHPVISSGLAALVAVGGIAVARLTGSVPSQTITVVARDFAFELPDSIASGRTTIRLQNRGTEFHHVQLVRFAPGKTLRDYLTDLQRDGRPPAWAIDLGGPNTPAAGGESRTTVELAPGRYGVLCFIPSGDGQLHVMKGMMKELVVTATPARTDAPVPAPDVTLRLTDYDFTFSAPLTAGERLVRVTTAAGQPHEVVFVRLAPGKTVQQVAAWAERPEGPPPGEPIGGTSAIADGLSNDVHLSLTPGEYGLICFIPDAKDGKPHVAHGMVKQFTVR